MDKPKPQISDKQSDNKTILDFTNWLAVSKHNGWLVYERKLKEKIESYAAYMDNPDVAPQMLKNLQLIKKGLKMALDIPKGLEIKAKALRKTEKRKTPSRIDEFFRVGK